MKRFLLAIITALLLIPIMSYAAAPKYAGVIDSDGMVLIPEGRFYMGYNEGEMNERPEHEVFLKAYRIDGHEVSAKEFALFLSEKGNPEDQYFSCDEYSDIICITKEGEQTVNSSGKNIVRFEPRPGYDNYPANNVSWYGAKEFCRWKEKRLPTEAEWEKAARGDDKRLYPWGDRIPIDLLARYDKELAKYGLDVLLPVDALPTGRSFYGLYNMAGNILEWIDHWYRTNYCDSCDPSGAEYVATASEILGLQDKIIVNSFNDSDIPPKYNTQGSPVPVFTQGPPVGVFKVLRGGSWYDKYYGKLRSSYRFWLDPLERYPYTGFRCATSDEKPQDLTSKPKSEAPPEVTVLPVLVPPVVPVEKPALK